MGLFDFVKKGAGEMFIARPDEAKDLIVFKWPDRTIPMKAQITVGQDECALFYKDGVFVGKVDAGRHTLETSNIPFLSRLIDTFTGKSVPAAYWIVEDKIVFTAVRVLAHPQILRFEGRRRPGSRTEFSARTGYRELLKSPSPPGR